VLPPPCQPVCIHQEIEKTAEKQVLHSLLMPWELGKLPASPVNPVINTSEVIWVCTSNSGEELVFEFSHHNGVNKPSSREQYKKLMSRMRARLADELGVRGPSSPINPFNLTFYAPGTDCVSRARRTSIPTFHAR